MPYHFQIKQAKPVLLSLFHLYSATANLASPQACAGEVTGVIQASQT